MASNVRQDTSTIVFVQREETTRNGTINKDTWKLKVCTAAVLDTMSNFRCNISQDIISDYRNFDISYQVVYWLSIRFCPPTSPGIGICVSMYQVVLLTLRVTYQVYICGKFQSSAGRSILSHCEVYWPECMYVSMWIFVFFYWYNIIGTDRIDRARFLFASFDPRHQYIRSVRSSILLFSSSSWYYTSMPQIGIPLET